MNYIVKIIMNSLYGRFGMSDNFNNILIIDNKELNKLLSKNTNQITDKIELDENT